MKRDVTEKNRRIRERLRSLGLCPICGRQPADGKKICERCVLKSAARAKRTREARAAAGLCQRCGQPATDARLCAACRVKERTRLRLAMQQRKKDKMARGACNICGREPPVSGHLACLTCRAKKKALVIRIKRACFEHYGGARCCCCGESVLLFLTLDHCNDDGAEERRLWGKTGGGTKFYRWLRDRGYPPGYQVLCFNCNSGRALNGGVCPHKETTT